MLILGAGGFLGINLVDTLLTRGVMPRCGRRKRSNVLALRQRAVPLVLADLDDPSTLTEAMRGVRVVMHLAGHYPRLSNTPDATLSLGIRQTAAVFDAAAHAGVERLVYVSSTATVAPRPGRASHEGDVFDQAPSFGTYHALKWHLEQLVAKESRFETVTVCPSACLGAHDWKAGTSAMLWQLRAGTCPPHPDGVLSWVSASDVAEALARLSTMRSPPKRLLLSAGSERFHELLGGLARRYGVRDVAPALSAVEALRLAQREEELAALERRRPALSKEIADLIVHGAAIDASLSRTALQLSYRSLDATLAAFDAWADRLSANFTPTQGKATCAPTPVLGSPR